ncbi:hypothetical protein [Kordiimonas pumila]|uniref:hypothetical protein n=1 Tax=Kordiimonas pumila TaxID=2161677 RepID=UPI001883AAA5|nr:hypothetical protein [Kordiimonas pumila]
MSALTIRSMSLSIACSAFTSSAFRDAWRVLTAAERLPHSSLSIMWNSLNSLGAGLRVRIISSNSLSILSPRMDLRYSLHAF